ncbi:LPS-assembly protein LptD [Acidipila sp. EB88]|uniref:LPS-assembly protein LptD n=1 Tax=Acidipila sp. EB88 TaxID=2305226 RepID=UPI00131577AF|nr:LPS assembly protein LptD [Acidipila sp. EB88]
MRTRTIWCITLILLCHHSLFAEGVTTQLPPDSPRGAGYEQQAGAVPQATAAPDPQATPQSKPSPVLPGAMPDTPLSPSTDPAFAPPAWQELPDVPDAAAVGITDAVEPDPTPLPPPPPPSLASDVIDTGIAVPIDAPPPGTPVHIEANQQSKTGDVYALDGDILILYKSYRIRADHATYNRATSTVDARGHVTVDGGPSDEHLVADHGTMNLEQHTAHFYDAVGTLGVRSITHGRYTFTAPNPFALTGRELLELGPGRYQVLRGTLTSCRLPNPDWLLIARSILVDNNTAHTRNATFTLFHLPLFFLPYASHPVEQQHRQSGILLPVFGNNTQKGFILGESVYLVLGRSADATIGAEYFSRRGYAPFGQIRYRGAGEDFASMRYRALLDRLPGTENQGGVDVVADARRKLDDHTRAVVDMEYLSSYVYREAFEENYSNAINSEAKSSAYVTREENGLAASGRFERYQNFRSATSGDEIRVLHVPELHFDMLDHPLGRTPLLLGGEASATALSRSEPGFQTSRLLPRLDLYPHLALPLSSGGWTLRAEAGGRDTFYGKTQEPGLPGNVPVAELGQTLNRAAFTSDVTFRPPVLERDFSSRLLQRLFGDMNGTGSGVELRHTIEPELSYHYVTGVHHFASTIRFDSTDILADTNELEYGLTQRLFLRHLHQHPCKGDEALGPNKMCGGGTSDWLTWTVLQRHYYNTNFGGAVVPNERNVFASTLDLSAVAFITSPRNNSPIISRLRLRTTSATDLQWDVDYDARTGRLQSSNLFATYRLKQYFFSVGDSRLFNLIQNPTTLPDAPTPNPNATSALPNFNQLHLAATYGSPTKHGLSAGMNLGYDLTLQETQYLGAQAGYNRDCCGFAFEMRRYSLGTVRDDTQYLFSFTLAGVGSAGSLNPVNRVF